MCNLEENVLFSTLILGSVFSNYVVFYGDIYDSFKHRCAQVFYNYTLACNLNIAVLEHWLTQQ